MSKVFEFKDVTRVTVVTDDGVVYEKYGAYEHGVELHLQDDGRTLKLFPAREAPKPDLDGADLIAILKERGGKH